MTYQIDATTRAAGEAEALRNAGRILGVLYGPETASLSVSVSLHAFDVLFRQAGSSSLVDVTVDGADTPVKTLIQEVQTDPVTSRVIHVDFRQVNMKKEMEADVDLRTVSESTAVKELGGTLITALSTLRIKCLPKDLVSAIAVDISALKMFDDTIRVKDLSIPAGIMVLTDPETTVAKVAAPLTEEQLKVMEEGAGPKSLEDIEVEEKGKKEGEAGEGAEETPAKGEPASGGKEEKK